MDPDEIGIYSLNPDNIDKWIPNIAEHQKYRYTCNERIREINDKIKTLEKKTKPGTDRIKKDQKIEYYTINIEKLRERDFCDVTDNTETYLVFADAFRNTMRYVPFDEMLSIISTYYYRNTGFSD